MLILGELVRGVQGRVDCEGMSVGEEPDSSRERRAACWDGRYQGGVFK